MSVLLWNAIKYYGAKLVFEVSVDTMKCVKTTVVWILQIVSGYYGLAMDIRRDSGYYGVSENTMECQWMP
jgi:hypothetical protein